MAFQRAERRKAFIKLAVTGPSGSGKTYSALRLAFGLGGKVAFIDTETGSGSLYASLGEYDVCELAAPFTLQRYQQAVSDAVAGGYGVLIIDSISHAWAGEGGLLAQKEALDQRGGNSFTNWATITKQHEAFKQLLLQAPLHIIATMRSKTEYVVDQGGGKAAPKKIGLAPVQREGMEYEFTVLFDVAADHSAIASKDRTGLFDGLNSLLSEDHGRRIRQWLDGAAEPPPAPASQPAAANPAAAHVETVKGILKEQERPIASVVASNGAPAPAAASGNGEEARCSVEECGKVLAGRMAETSRKAFGRLLCMEHQRAAAQDAARAGA